jgi:hypothetical protein
LLYNFNRNICTQANKAYDQAIMSMDASIKAKLTWEEAITQFDAELSLFKDDDTLASERRKHVAHCSQPRK